MLEEGRVWFSRHITAAVAAVAAALAAVLLLLRFESVKFSAPIHWDFLPIRSTILLPNVSTS